jgi:eukaryotic-like serine/threonine-protein kinase
MTHSAHPSVAESARQRADRAEAIKQAWRAGGRPDAAAALQENPDIAGDRAVALDLAYEEFCTREEAGEVLDSVAFCARFSFGASLRRLLNVHRFLDDHPDALGSVPVSWPAAGETVGDFLLLRELGRGSFSRVYLAAETTTGYRPVALKVSAAGSREAETLGPLSHPHLIPVLSSRPVGAWTVVAMPFTGTATLEDALSAAWPSGVTGATSPPRSAAILLEAADRGRQPDDPPFTSCPAFLVRAEMTHGDAVAAVAAGLFAAVAYLHEKGIAHRDIKPSNVLLAPSGHPYLLDFNLASRVADPWRLVGTLPYMAPEQLALMAKPDAPPPVASADGRPADVFACGVVLFELLTGRHPFGDPSALAGHRDRDQAAAALLTAQRAGHPDLGELNPQVGPAVRTAIKRCLALDPRERPTAAELAELFSRVGSRRRRPLAVPVLVGLGALALALSYLTPGKPADSPDVPATQPPAAPAPAVLTPFERGQALLQKGEHGLAAAEFNAIGKADQDGRAYGYAAYCLSLKKGAGPDEAIWASDEAIRLGYRTAPVYANRAHNHFKANRLEEAQADCNEALRLDPKLHAARYTRVTVYLRMHLTKQAAIPPEALADIDQVTAGMPNAPDVWSTAAQLYILTAAGNPAARDKAAQAVHKAVLAGKSPEMLRRNPVLHDALSGHKVYENALTLRPGRVALPANPHLASPIP